MTDKTFLLALAAAILGAASLILHAIAPRTKTPVDDKIRDEIDQLLNLFRNEQVVTFFKNLSTDTPKLTTSTTPPLGPIVALLVTLIGVAVACSIACTASQRVTTTRAIVDCTAANALAIGSTAASMGADKEHGGCMLGNIDWDCVTSKAIMPGVTIGGCAFIKVLATQPQQARIAATPNPGHVAFEHYRAEQAGGATFRTSTGDQ